MRLRYKAVTLDSRIVRGLVEAKDTAEAVIYLRNKELVPVSITPDKKNDLSQFLPFIGKVAQGDLVLFTRQLSSMLSSGLTLVKSLQILAEQMTGRAMFDIINSVVSDIEEGKNFSSAIAKYPEVFSPIYVSIIRSAESSGLLDRALLRMAENLEKQVKLRNTIRGALMYPAIVIVLMIVVVFVMMTVVIPQLSGLYKSLGVQLPIATKIVVGLSDFTVSFWPFIIVGLVLGIFLFRRWHKTEPGKLVMDNFMLKIPVFGSLSKKLLLTEFSRTLSLLIGSGSLIVNSLVQVSDTLSNIHYRNAVIDVAKRVENGVTIGDALSTYPLFPPILIQLVKIGEQTGKLDETLMKASEYFETETDQTVKTLTTALEPFIMITLGIGVAFLMVAVITPIYSIISSIK